MDQKISLLGTILEDFKQFISHIVKHAQRCVAHNDLLERYDGISTSTGFQCAANIVKMRGFIGVIGQKE